jgi:ribonuclease HII
MMPTWIEDIVERWHKSGDDSGPLHEWLGMSYELYGRFVEGKLEWIVGIDEVGYGALAGPLVIGGVLAPTPWTHPLLRDSKAFEGSTEQKERARAKVLDELAFSEREDPAATYFLHSTPSEEVDRIGVGAARLRAFEAVAMEALNMVPEGRCLVVIDGNLRVPGLEHACLPKADSFVPQVSAASIVAKVHRDTEMRLLDRQYPGYLFAKHKGYGSEEHQAAILRLGLCPLHRRSYKMKFLENSSSPSQQ